MTRVAEKSWLVRIHDGVVGGVGVTDGDQIDAYDWCKCPCSELDPEIERFRGHDEFMDPDCPVDSDLLEFGEAFYSAACHGSWKLMWGAYLCIHKREAELIGRPDLYEQLQKDRRYIEIQEALEGA